MNDFDSPMSWYQVVVEPLTVKPDYLTTSTIALGNLSPMDVAASIHQFFLEIGARDVKISFNKFAIKATIFQEVEGHGLHCTVKTRIVRVLTEDSPPAFILNFARRSGDAVVFNRVFHTAKIAVEGNTPITASQFLWDVSPLLSTQAYIFANPIAPTTPDRRPTPVNPDLAPIRLTYTGRGASVTHPLYDDVVPPFGLPTFDLAPTRLTYTGRGATVTHPLDDVVPPFGLPTFDLPLFRLPPFGLQPLESPREVPPPAPSPEQLHRLVGYCKCMTCDRKFCRIPAPGLMRCAYCTHQCQYNSDNDD
jgi:hypothetical protein